MGKIIGIKNMLVKAKGISGKLFDIVEVDKGIFGEIVEIKNDTYFIQIFGKCDGIKIGDNINSLNEPLSVELGPHLVGRFFDGLENSLENNIFYNIRKMKRTFKGRFDFSPLLKKGKKLNGGEIVGYSGNIPILLHPEQKGKLEEIYEGKFRLKDPIGYIDGKPFFLSHRWPIRIPRPFRKYVWKNDLMITGQRVVDALFPVKLGGTVAIAGGFGSGKTVFQHNFSKFAKVDYKIFVGCGERGNEMADFIEMIKKANFLKNTTIIANTSNMPIVARESSIFAGATIGEYFRDMGYNVLLMVDSLSRAAEAIREIGGLMEIIPAEEGYPPFLQERIQEFLSRAGMVSTLSGKIGSLTIISSVSPPSGDFSEPVTKYTTNKVGVGIFLSQELAYARIYPAVDTELSFSKYEKILSDFWDNVYKNSSKSIKKIKIIIEKGIEAEKIEKVVGADSLSGEQKIILHIYRIIKEDFLMQNAFDDLDMFSEPKKQALILLSISNYFDYLINFYSKTGKMKFNKDIESMIKKMKTESTKNVKKYFEKIKLELGYV